MTQEIIELARQSGWTDDLLEVSFVSPMLEAFAKLVAAKAFQNGYEKGIAAFTEAVNLEREACAKVVQIHLEASDDLRTKNTLASVLDYIKFRGEA